MTRRASGTTFLEISAREFERILIRLPPLEQQRRIAEILDTIDETIQATKRVTAKYEGLRSGISADLLSKRTGGVGTRILATNGKTTESQSSLGSSSSGSGHMPEGRSCRLRDIGIVVGGGTPSRERSEYWRGPIPWLTPGELTGISDKYISEVKEGISELGLAASGATVLPEESLLMTSRASIGFCALAGRPMATNQGFQNLVPNRYVDSSFLFHLGRTLRREMTRRASETTFLEISGREFGQIEVHLPPLEEQRRVASILDIIDNTIRVNGEHRDKLRELRAGLSVDLLSGRVRTVAA